VTNRNAEAFPASNDENLGGLSKREYAAIHILAGLAAGRAEAMRERKNEAFGDLGRQARNEAVEIAVELADKLMDAL